MSYFAHAFKKVFIGDTFVDSGNPQDLEWGQFGFFDAKTWEAVPVGDADVALHKQVVLAMGSFHTVDKVGGYGGLKESIKSQVIDPRYVRRFWKVVARWPEQQMVGAGWDGTNADTAPKFYCGQTYRLRIDAKGALALRIVGHNLYHVFDVFTGCCTDQDNPVAVDPIWVLAQFAQQINGHPIFSKFLHAMVTTPDGDINVDTYEALTDAGDIDAAIGGLRLEARIVDPQFFGCSSDVLDYYNEEPLMITSAQLVDEGGDVCSGFKQLAFTQLWPGRPPQGSGMMVYRDFVLSQAYKQERYPSDVRLREALDMHGITPNVTSISSLYDTYYILYGVPRRSNPTGVYDCDEYLIQLHTQTMNDLSDFEAWVTSYLESAGRGVAIEDFSGSPV